MFGQQELQELLSFESGGAKVVSMYLDADTAQQPKDSIKLQARGLLRELEGLDDDVAAIENYLNLEHDWSAPGLAIFSCTAQEFFRAYPAEVAFRNRVRVSRKPYVKPLAHLLDHYAHYGVIVVDQIGARFYEFHLGELQATEGVMGEDVRKLKRGSGSSATGMRGGQGGARHEEEAAHKNMKEAAAAAGKFFARRDIRRLFIGGTNENVAQFREVLPKRLLSCLAGTFPIGMTANDNEVRDRSLALLKEANAEREERMVDNLVTAAAKGAQAVTGLEESLRAVSDGRVQTLVISDGFRVPGYRHEVTGYFSAGPNGGLGDGRWSEVDDVVEEAVFRTLEQGGHVEVIADNERLEQAGRIGAMLRY
jgi:peptide subunit release factor 1 (eRF1)